MCGEMVTVDQSRVPIEIERITLVLQLAKLLGKQRHRQSQFQQDKKKQEGIFSEKAQHQLQSFHLLYFRLTSAIVFVAWLYSIGQQTSRLAARKQSSTIK